MTLSGTEPVSRLYLASASPRRRELLQQLGLHFEVLAQDVDETQHAGESAEDYVLRITRDKAEAALRDQQRSLPLPVLSADTSVVCEGNVLGKPASLLELTAMLTQLSGRTHQVLTAVMVADDNRQQSSLVSTNVCFRKICPDEIPAYWNTGEPRDKAGGYAIQGLGAMFVNRIEGSYSSVVGLPLFETMQLLAGYGITALQVLEDSSS